MKLYLVRHAESISNKNGVVSDDNSPLSEEGIAQAEKLGKRLSALEISVIYTSPLTRAKQTAGIISSHLKDLKIIETKKVIEKKEASSIIGKSRKELPWDLIKKMRVDPDWRYEDGESFNDVRNRIIEFLAEIEKYPEETNILIVTHTSFIKHLTAYVVLGEKFFVPEIYYCFSDRLETINGSVTILERKQKYYETKSSWYLVSWMS